MRFFWKWCFAMWLVATLNSYKPTWTLLVLELVVTGVWVFLEHHHRYD